VSQHWVSDSDGSDNFEWDSDGNGEEPANFNAAGAGSSALRSTNTDAPGPSTRVIHLTDPYICYYMFFSSCYSGMFKPLVPTWPGWGWIHMVIMNIIRIMISVQRHEHSQCYCYLVCSGYDCNVSVCLWGCF
jgi:hypothetical protein